MLSLPLMFLVLFGSVYDDTPRTINPDPSFIEGTYEEWIDDQPSYLPLTVTSIAGSDGADFLLIFEDGLTDSLEVGLLDQWTADIALQGLSTEVVEVTYSTPEELKAYLTDKYNDGLEGAVLVGNLPAPWSALADTDEKSSETFPSDYFGKPDLRQFFSTGYGLGLFRSRNPRTISLGKPTNSKERLIEISLRIIFSIFPSVPFTTSDLIITSQTFKNSS